jgi:hypothetical protein
VKLPNGLYAHKSFVETEITFSDHAKNTWLECQGYKFENEPGDTEHEDFESREQATRRSAVVYFYGKLAVDFFTCDKLLVPNVTLRIKLVRSHNDFVIISDAADKHYSVVIHEANIFVRKLSVTENVYESLERSLQQHPALYRFIEDLPKTYIVPANLNTWKQENIFLNEPVRRFALAMNTNIAFGASRTHNPFHYRKFNLRSITIYRNGIPICGTPIDTTRDKRLFLNSQSALAFGQSGNGINLSQFEDHYVLVFDLTSTLEATFDFIHPELTHTALTIELQFSQALEEPIELLLLGEKATTVYINKDRNVSKNALI